MPKSSLEALCRVGASERYDLNGFVVIQGSTIKDASSSVTSEVERHLQEISGITGFCFGVCDVQKLGGIPFNCREPSSWNRESLDRHHSELSREDPGRNGFIALAMITSESIPIGGGTENAMVYALRLRDKMNECYNLTNPRQLAFVERAAAGYVLYMAFSLQGNGYALEKAKLVSDQHNMAQSINSIANEIIASIRFIKERSGREVKRFYIGKSNIRKIGRTPFDCKNPDTWRTDAIETRYRDHCRREYGRSGLLVVAVVTRESIPAECLEGGYVNSAERYVLKLERSLIKRFSETSRERLFSLEIKHNWRQHLADAIST